MPRPIPPLPLQGAQPQLTPTSRPLQINIGATPPPTRSALGELGQAFREWNPTLHGMLQSAAAQADNDALAQGELEAVKTKAATRLGELDVIIKDGVDVGTIPHVRAPAFERGFRSRVGSELAQSAFQEALLSQLPNVTKVDGYVDAEGNPMPHQAAVEKVVNETRAKYFGQLHASDIYAKTAFDQTAQGVVAGFRQRAAEGYTANYKAAGEQAMADDNSERLMNLATAPESDAVLFRENVRQGLDQLRTELPKTKVNEFYLKNVVQPTIAKLAANRQFTEAAHLLDEMDTLDVTGKGGLLGQTAVGKGVLSELRGHVESKRKTSGTDDWERLKQEREMKHMAGEDAAGKALNDLRLASNGQLPQDKRFEMIETFRKANPQDSIAATAYAATVNKEYESEAKYRSDPRKVSDLEMRIKSLAKTDLAMNRAAVEAAYNLGEIAPSDRTRLTQQIDKLDALYGAYDDADVNRFKKDVYAVPLGAGMPPTINFASTDPGTTGKLWDSLIPEYKNRHESLVTAYWQRAVEDDLVNRVKDPLKVGAEKATTFDNATIKARAYALTLLTELSHAQAKQGLVNNAKKEVQALKQAAVWRKPPTLTFDYAQDTGATRPLRDAVPGDPVTTEPVTRAMTYHIPANGREDFAAYKADKSLLKADRDFAEVYLPGAMRPQPVSLARLAKDALDEKLTPDMRAKAKEVYGISKSVLGFTPDEIKNAQTKHGVPITPREIDPNRIAVFRSIAELNKHWNEGKPDETFFSVGDAVDPTHTITARQFYVAQRALLTR